MPQPVALPVFDGHNDTLEMLYLPEKGGGRSFFTRSDQGHIDLPRAQAGGFGGGFFSVYVPSGPSDGPRAGAELNAERTSYDLPLAPALDPVRAREVTLQGVAGLFRLEAAAAGQIRVVRTIAELNACLQSGTIAVVLHFEGAEAIDPKLDALQVFYQAGLRSLGIVWSRPNAFASGVPFRFPHTPDTGPGLSDAGRELVRACNELGIVVDLSHINERGFWDTAACTRAPLVVTHTAAHALCPSTRNLTDPQLDAVRDSGGVVGVNFHVAFLRSDGRLDADTPLAEIVRHIDYIVDRIGIDHVAFGSDFDGATMPRELADVAGLPRLLGALRDRGYDDDALRRLTHANWVRVLGQTWK